MVALGFRVLGFWVYGSRLRGSGNETLAALTMSIVVSWQQQQQEEEELPSPLLKGPRYTKPC